jgi:hypothetical protein
MTAREALRDLTGDAAVSDVCRYVEDVLVARRLTVDEREALTTKLRLWFMAAGQHGELRAVERIVEQINAGLPPDRPAGAPARS